MNPADATSPVRTLPIESVNLPFLGSKRENHSTFQYLLQAVSTRDVTFIVPGWVVRREHLREGDRVDFHLPFRTPDAELHQQGEIVSVRREQPQNDQICRAELRESVPLHNPVYTSLATGEIVFCDAAGAPADSGELLVSLLRDLHLLKRGVGVYFKHLVPLFSRITLFPEEDYGALRRTILEDIRLRIETNMATFSRWHEEAGRGELTPANLPQRLDLETLRVATEAEMENELLSTTFDTPVIKPYIAAIRLLEHRLYLNYNTLVLLYARGL